MWKKIGFGNEKLHKTYILGKHEINTLISTPECVYDSMVITDV